MIQTEVRFGELIVVPYLTCKQMKITNERSGGDIDWMLNWKKLQTPLKELPVYYLQ